MLHETESRIVDKQDSGYIQGMLALFTKDCLIAPIKELGIQLVRQKTE